MPIIGEYYDVQLAGCESPYFLVYSKGDFFKPHQDRSHGEGYSDRVQMRKISAVIFLNSERRELSMEDYCGGKLVFYDLGRGVSPETRRLPVTGEAGLLVTFPSDTLHEVTPVSHGQRYTIASFFY
jgi:predicted 2-oxoglutarate/Fe(II)-dependent dioxygenase YbiX